VRNKGGKTRGRVSLVEAGELMHFSKERKEENVFPIYFFFNLL